MTFVGRKRELSLLAHMADANDFRMIVVYGRRRIGKTALIQEFCKNRRTLQFTATETTNAENLRNFSLAVRRFFQEPEVWGGFPDWAGAFDYLAQKVGDDPANPPVIVFDEFPYAAMANKALPSILQIAIDHSFKTTNATMILCGSNEGFMENHVLGAKSPLYGRRNAQIHLQPLDLPDAAQLMPSESTWEEQIDYYATLGGTPYYLEQTENGLSFAQNIEHLCLSLGGVLYEEPQMLMRQEVHEPAVYFSVLNAIGSGKNTPKLIAETAGLSSSSAVSPYLNTLSSLGIIERIVPFGDNPIKSKKGQWRIKDPFFAYWFRFVSPAIPWVESGNAHTTVTPSTSGPEFNTYVGQQYESMCLQWLVAQAGRELLPFQPLRFGKWWGTDPEKREQTDIDIVMDNQREGSILLGECKWRNTLNESETIATLKDRHRLLAGYKRHEYYLFTKHPVSNGTRDKTQSDPHLHVVDAQKLLAEHPIAA